MLASSHSASLSASVSGVIAFIQIPRAAQVRSSYTICNLPSAAASRQPTRSVLVEGAQHAAALHHSPLVVAAACQLAASRSRRKAREERDCVGRDQFDVTFSTPCLLTRNMIIRPAHSPTAPPMLSVLPLVQ